MSDETATAEKTIDGDFKEQSIENALAVQPPRDVVLSSQDASEFIDRAVKQADALKSIIDKKNLAITIGGGTKKHVLIDGWMTLMALNGVMPFTVSVYRERDTETKKLTAYVVTEIRRVSDGFVLTRVESSCSQNESRWARADDYAVVSMAQTRGVGKGCRQLFGWVMALAGYDATPAEEMPDAAHAQPRARQDGDADARPLTPMDAESKAAIQKAVKDLIAAAPTNPQANEMLNNWRLWFDAQNGPKHGPNKENGWENLWADDRYTYAAITVLGLKREEKPKPKAEQDSLEMAEQRAQGEGPAGVRPMHPDVPNKIPPAQTSQWNKEDQELVRSTYQGVQKLAKEGTKRAIEALAKFTAFMDANKLNWTGQRGLTNIWTRPELRDEVFRILEITPPADEGGRFDPDEVPA